MEYLASHTAVRYRRLPCIDVMDPSEELIDIGLVRCERREGLVAVVGIVETGYSS